MQGGDHVFVNQEGRGFEEQIPRYLPRTPWEAMGTTVFDFHDNRRWDFPLTELPSHRTDGPSNLRQGYIRGAERAKCEAWCSLIWTHHFLQGASNNRFSTALHMDGGDWRIEDPSEALGPDNNRPHGVNGGMTASVAVGRLRRSWE